MLVNKLLRSKNPKKKNFSSFSKVDSQKNERNYLQHPVVVAVYQVGRQVVHNKLPPFLPNLLSCDVIISGPVDLVHEVGEVCVKGYIMCPRYELAVEMLVVIGFVFENNTVSSQQNRESKQRNF